ncbi:MAG: NlpC/P60 family protein [Oricola sp.]
MVTLDRRLNASRPDLADKRLEGRVEASRFVEGRPAVVTAPVVDIRNAPAQDAGVDTQFLMGDRVRVFEIAEGWAWLQGERDSYVGYAAESALSFNAPEPTHRVIVPRTFRYPGPELKKRPLAALSMGSQVAVVDEEERRGNRYVVLPDHTALVAIHVAPLAETAPDYVAVAEQLIHTPYLWGGTSGFGVDCSGLVHLAMRMAGRDILRDTDMQEETVGDLLDTGGDFSSLKRGDLVFWKGHVGIMVDAVGMLHASGKTMTVTLEPLADAIARIEPLYGLPTSVRRP